MIIISGLSRIKRNLKSGFCRRRIPAKVDKPQRLLYVDYGVLQKIFQKIHVVKAVWTVLSLALWRFDNIKLK